jgi:hypothetical protein
MGWVARVVISRRRIRFLSSPQLPDWLWDPSYLLSNDTGDKAAAA